MGGASSDDRSASAPSVLLDHLPFLAWFKDRRGRFVTVNATFAKACGRASPKELVGLTDSDVWPAELAARYRADDENVIASGKPRLVEEPIVGPDGTAQFETFKTPVFDAHGELVGTVGFARDVTARHEAERTLREREDNLRLFTELASDYVYTVDLDKSHLTPTMIAGSLERTTGINVEHIAERGGWLEVVHPEDRPQIAGALGALMSGTAQIVEYRIVLPDGSVRWLHDSVQPVADGSGVVKRIVGGVQDVTERRRQEDELKRRNDQLTQAAKLEAVGRLANGVAHDFNNLLTAIHGFTEMILNKLPHESDARDDLREVQAAAERGADLTKQLLAFSRSSSEAPVLLDANAHLASLARLLGRLLGSDVAFSLTPSTTPAVVRIAPTHLEQVILNLAANARDAMPSGGSFAISVRREDLDEPSAAAIGLTAGDYVAIRVVDTGCGFDDVVRERLFEPFFTTKVSGRGTGLGLATSYGVVRQAGGAMLASGAPGRGSTFEVFLPAVDAPLPAKVQRVPERRYDAPACRILFVDDDAAIRDLAGKYLRQLGHQVRTAGHAGEALVVAEDDALPIDVVVTDLVMPDLDGSELVRRLRVRRPDLKIVFMTGRFPAASASAELADIPVLQKPFSLPDLAQSIGHVLARSSSGR